MAWWNFWRPRVDKLDGYAPTAPRHDDPWTTPEVLTAIETRARMDGFNADGFKNELTGIGDWNRDKMLGGRQGGPDFNVYLLSGVDCENRWRGSDLGGRIIETIPDEMTREGWDIQIQPAKEDDEKTDAFPDQQQPPPGPPPFEQGPKPLPAMDDSGTDMAEAIAGKLEELGADDIFWEALSYERAYGGAAILIGADDGNDLSKPLDENNVREVRHLTAFRGGWDGELIAWSYYNDPKEPSYGYPETYMLRNLGTPIARLPVPGERLNVEPLPPQTSSYNVAGLLYWVHESRLLIFPGVAVSRRARTQMRGWGDSIFTRVDQVLSQYDQTWGGIANLMSDFSQGVLKIDGLAETMAGNNKSGTRTLQNRALGLQLARSISRIMLIDAEEEFSRDTVNLGGIADVLQQFALRLAAAADMPVTLLMGQSPAGLNATGASDIRFFYDRIAAKQKKRMLPQLRKLIRLIMLSADGPTDGQEPEKWSITFRPLYQMTDAEQADIRLKVAQTDQIYINAQVLSPEEVAASAFGGSEWTMERQIDFDGREEMAKQAELDKAKQEKAAKEAMNKPKPGESSQPGEDEDKPANGGHKVTVEIAPK